MAQSHTLPHTLPGNATTAVVDTTPVRVWLLTVAALVFLLVSVGGATRLTGSGLSITEWKPIMGIVPPLSEADWHDAFDKYRQIPQYQQVNKGMSLGAFKRIFWWEWAHRFLGRLVGVAFLVPFLVLLGAGRIPRTLLPRLVGIFALGGLQGFIGWYMVSSGLVDRISVSHYRLAVHLGLAILILGALLWVALSLDKQRDRPGAAAAPSGWAAAIAALLFVQILLGALVAGMKAGMGYNTWPLMDGQLIPSGLGIMQPWYLNLFENAMTVQFNHRVVAYLAVLAVAWHTWSVLRVRGDARVRGTAVVLAVGTLLQVALGIWTLLAQVPLSLGLAHQAGAAALFAVAIWHLYAVRHSKDTA
jgi:cytochrome c oxidase assembly protein subunit 15